MAEKPKLTSMEWNVLVNLWAGGDPETFPPEFWDQTTDEEVTDEEEALLVDLMARGYVDEERPWFLTEQGKDAVLAGPMGHLVCFADEEGNFYGGVLLKLQWISEPLRQAFGTPDVPVETILRLVRREVGDHLIAQVQMLDDDQVEAQPVRVALRDIWLESELDLDWPGAETVLCYCLMPITLEELERSWEEREKAVCYWLIKRHFIRQSTTCGGSYQATDKGKIALAAADAKRRREAA